MMTIVSQNKVLFAKFCHVSRSIYSHGFACFIFILLLFPSCNKVPIASNITDFDNIPNFSLKREEQFVPNVDTIYINVDFDKLICSMNGNFFIKEDAIYFADKSIGEVLQFDYEGKYLGNVIKKGRGPNEVREIEYVTTCANGNVLVMDASWSFTLFDSLWNRTINSMYLNFNQSTRTYKDRFSHPDPNNLDIYEIAYDWECVKLYHDCAIFPITSEHPKYNGYEGGNRKHFYKYSYIFACLGLHDSTVEMLGHYPPLYTSKMISSFSGVMYDLMDNQMIYSFQADSLIYVMDLSTKQTISSFGISGSGMNQEYETYRTFEQAEDNWLNDSQLYGYYYDLRYEIETDQIYRLYTLGNHTQISKLQVYKHGILIGELTVPKETKYVGYINGMSYFVVPPDYENDRIILLRYSFQKSDRL